MAEFIQGAKLAREAIETYEKRMAMVTGRALEEAARAVVGDARDEFGHGAGPRNLSGHLAGSIRADGSPRKVGFETYELKVGPTEKAYSRVVELGKKGARHRKPHPYFKPGYDHAKHRLNEIFKRAWRGVKAKGA